MSSLVLDRRKAVTAENAGRYRYAVHVVRGAGPILAVRAMLIVFSERCGQPGTMEDLEYFLTKPGLLQRIPCLYLIVRQQNLTLPEVQEDDLLGALLLYEYSVLGLGLRAFATNDRSGRGTMLALPHQRLKVAALISRVLLDRGAHMMMLSFRRGSGEEDRESSHLFDFPAAASAQQRAKVTARWALRERSISGYLPLLESYDATLAKIGQKTRSNMRYYRRRAESQLGCSMVAEVQIGEAEFLAFNRESMFPVPDRVALWRLRTLKELHEPVLMGLRDKDGRWLSILGGRRYKDRMEILWQANRAGLANQSLSTVMRAYCMEHEIARGMTRLYIEGGTSHSLHHSFVKEELMDLVVIRRSPLARMMEKLAQRKVSPDNELADVVKDPGTQWYPC